MTRAQEKLNKKLRKAAASGDVKGIEEMLAAGADIESQGGFFSLMHTPLAEAAWHGKTEAVRVLLEKGANTEAQDIGGETPLMLAVSMRHLDVAVLLLKHGANVAAQGAQSSKTAMILATATKDPELREKFVTMIRNAQIDQTIKKVQQRERAEREKAAQEKTERDARRNKNPDVVVFEEQISNRTVEEVYNFKSLERTILVRKEPEGPVEAVTRQSFSDLGDAPGLRKAFQEHAKRGGKTPEGKVFPDSRSHIKHLPRKDI